MSRNFELLTQLELEAGVTDKPCQIRPTVLQR